MLVFVSFCFVFNHSIPGITKMQLLFAIRFSQKALASLLHPFSLLGRPVPFQGSLLRHCMKSGTVSSLVDPELAP